MLAVPFLRDRRDEHGILYSKSQALFSIFSAPDVKSDEEQQTDEDEGHGGFLGLSMAGPKWR